MPDSTSVVIFGASGDLSHRKLIPALYNLYRKKRISGNFRIFGTAGRDWSDDDLRRTSREFLDTLKNTSIDEE